MKRLVIIGAGGHGKVGADIALLRGFKDICFVDDDVSMLGTRVLGFPVIGGLDSADLHSDTDDVFVAVGDALVRKRFFSVLALRGIIPVTLCHPSACIGTDARIGAGTLLAASAIVNPGTNVGKGCIVNTGATVDHDCSIGDFCHISVGAHVAGTVTVGEGTWIGAGAVVSNNVNIVSGCMIGAGAVVVNDIAIAGTYVGVPARLIKRGLK